MRFAAYTLLALVALSAVAAALAHTKPVLPLHAPSAFWPAAEPARPLAVAKRRAPSDLAPPNVHQPQYGPALQRGGARISFEFYDSKGLAVRASDFPIARLFRNLGRYQLREDAGPDAEDRRILALGTGVKDGQYGGLEPGEYELTAYSRRWGRVTHRFSVRRGESRVDRIDLPFHERIICIRFVHPDGTPVTHIRGGPEIDDTMREREPVLDTPPHVLGPHKPSVNMWHASYFRYRRSESLKEVSATDDGRWWVPVVAGKQSTVSFHLHSDMWGQDEILFVDDFSGPQWDEHIVTLNTPSDFATRLETLKKIGNDNPGDRNARHRDLAPLPSAPRVDRQTGSAPDLPVARLDLRPLGPTVLAFAQGIHVTIRAQRGDAYKSYPLAPSEIPYLLTPQGGEFAEFAWGDEARFGGHELWFAFHAQIALDGGCRLIEPAQGPVSKRDSLGCAFTPDLLKLPLLRPQKAESLAEFAARSPKVTCKPMLTFRAVGELTEGLPWVEGTLLRLDQDGAAASVRETLVEQGVRPELSENQQIELQKVFAQRSHERQPSIDQVLGSEVCSLLPLPDQREWFARQRAWYDNSSRLFSQEHGYALHECELNPGQYYVLYLWSESRDDLKPDRRIVFKATEGVTDLGVITLPSYR